MHYVPYTCAKWLILLSNYFDMYLYNLLVHWIILVYGDDADAQDEVNFII